MNVSAKGYAAEVDPQYNYDMGTAPRGAKVILLNFGGCACIGVVTERDRFNYAAWCPLPKRDREKEKRAGVRI